jgi:mono/diheme cytochrome c family protein
VHVRDALIFLNIAAILVIVVFLCYRVVSVRRNPEHDEPQNLTPFANDDTLETTRLERVLRWSLICATVVAVGLPLYWLREPTRQDKESSAFDERAEERGEVLYANDQMDAYDSARSLACANCHGVEGEGGSALFTVPATQTGTGRPVQVAWRAPALNSVLSRFTPAQVREIITYGRPGTPMAAWGIDGGGPKGPQAVTDLIAYLESIQLGREGARDQVDRDVDALVEDARRAVEDSEDELAGAREELADASSPETRAAAQQAVAAAQQARTTSREWLATVEQAGEGELLFDVSCARCHTKGWSYFDPSDPSVPLPSPPGSGAFGPKLDDGATLNQFPGETGLEQQIEWVTNGAEENQAYGVRGISSGRMPHFGNILSADQIRAIVEYERSL